jgi:fucose 4-O-acetylase-like acetyltransferase
MRANSAGTAPTGRIEWIDAARGIGIVLVVLGHVNAGLFGAALADPSPRSFLHQLSYFIYNFHMPLFALLSGAMAPRSVAKPGSVFWSDKLGTLVYPYVVWSVLQLVVQIQMSHATNNPASWADLLRIFYDPPMQFWFIYCLVIWYALYRAVVLVGGGAGVFFFVAAVTTVVLYAIDAGGGSVVGRTRDHLLFFATGAAAANWFRPFGALPAWALAALAVVTLPMVAVVAPFRYDVPWPVVFLLPLPGVTGSIAVSALLVRTGSMRWLQVLGRLSLEIYVAHMLATAGMRILLVRLGITSVPLHVVLGTVVGVGFPVVLAVSANAVGFPYLFRWPALKRSEQKCVPPADEKCPETNVDRTVSPPA